MWEGGGSQGWLGPLCTPTERPPCCSLSAFWPVDFLRNFFSQTLGLGTQKERLLDELTLEGVTRYMQSERCKSSPCFAPLAHSWPRVTSQPHLSLPSNKKPNSNQLRPKREY